VSEPGPETEVRRQGRHWAVWVVLAIVVAYAIAFAVDNRQTVSVHWLVGTTDAPLIWAFIVTFVLGAVAGVLIPQLYRRRRRRRSRA
jgi:uncharacterized integral membrane protein